MWGAVVARGRALGEEIGGAQPRERESSKRQNTEEGGSGSRGEEKGGGRHESVSFDTSPSHGSSSRAHAALSSTAACCQKLTDFDRLSPPHCRFQGHAIPGTAISQATLQKKKGKTAATKKQ